MTKKIETDEARQGLAGKRVSTVLVVSLCLAIIAAVGIYFYGELIDDDPLLEKQIENTE